MKRILSFVISLCLTLNILLTLSVNAFDTAQMESLGYITALDQEILSYGLIYTELSAQKNKNQKAYIFEYTPNTLTVPQVEFGSDTSTKTRLKDITKRYEKEGVRVVGAMNGDFFSFQTGVPMGVVIKDGVIYSSDPSKNALGFTGYGHAMIGNPNIHFEFSCIPNVDDADERKPYSFVVDYFNKYPSVYAIYFLNDAYSDTTESTSASTEIVLKPLGGSLMLNSSMSFEVTEVRKDSVNSDIPDGCYILCGDNRSFASSLESIHVGDKIRLDITAEEGWNSVVTALGGGDIIVENGVFNKETVDESHERASNPRTAIGVCENGNIIFFANDGRADDAAGVNYETLAQIMIDMGCKTVINLDGGGSTTVYAATAFDSVSKLVNNPSDGSERYVSNALLFLNNMQSDNRTGGVKITNDEKYILPGSSLELNAIYHDKSYRPFEPESETVFSEQTKNGRTHGAFDNNTFIAQKPGNVTLCATNDGIKGLFEITIPQAPTEFIFKDGEIVIEKGKELSLDIKATYDNNDVVFNNYDILEYRFREKGQDTFTDDHTAGRISDNKFHAEDYFDGVMEIFMQDTSLEIPLRIIPEIYSHSIPTDLMVITTDGVNVKVEETSDEYLEESCYRIEFPQSEQNGFQIRADNYELNKESQAVTFMAHNYSEAFISFLDDEGNEIRIPYEIERNYSVFNGWYKYKADISAVNLEEYKLKNLFECDSYTGESMKFTSFLELIGEERLFEDIEGSWAKEHIIDVYYQELMKGKPYHTAKMFDGQAPLTRAEFATILCRLLKINLTAFINVKSDFADINTVGSWAWNQIHAVNAMGLMSGSTEDDGKKYFRPQDGITRAEAMQVFGRLTKTPEKTVKLNFDDLDSLPAWSLESTAKVVTYGIFSGYEDNTLRPYNKLTRNEAAKILSLFNTQSYYDLIAIEK